MTERLHMLPRHRAQLEALLREHLPDVEVWAYGSRVNGQSHDGSDLDLMLRGPGLEEIDISALGDFTQALHDSTIPFLVEARDWARLPDRFHREIEREYVVLRLGLESGEWSVVKVGDVAEKIAMGPFGSSIKVDTFVPVGVPVINGRHLHERRVDEDPGFDYITEEHADRLANSNVRSGDIVFTHRGTIGQVSYVPRNARHGRYVVSQSQMYLRCDESRLLPEFAAQWFASPQGQHALLANASQVGVPSIAQPVSYLKTIEIPFPPMAEQRAIAHILGTLDDKIELNRRMNETLEAMARALFDSWFVDFDPVRAKREGRGPALSGRTADPTEEGLMSQMPQRWKPGRLGDVAEVRNRGVEPASLPSDTPHIGLRDMPRSSIALSEWGRAGRLTSRKSRFETGEILFGKLRPYFRKVGVAPVGGVCSTDIVVIAPKTADSFAFVLGVVSSTEFITYTDRTSTGTRMPRTSWKTMGAYQLPIPDSAVLRAYERMVGPLVQRVLSNIREARKLEAKRDLLLGELVSGSLRVGGAMCMGG